MITIKPTASRCAVLVSEKLFEYGQALPVPIFESSMIRSVDAFQISTWCHTRVGGVPSLWPDWIPACAGMTGKGP